MRLSAPLVATFVIAAPVTLLAQTVPESALIAQVNVVRAKAGLPPCAGETRLGRIAAAHAADMARHAFVGHVGSDGAGMIERALRAGYGYAYIAENVAAGQRNAETAVATWMASGGHRRNLLAPEASQCGVGHSIEVGRVPKYGDYWVIVLGHPAPP